MIITKIRGESMIGAIIGDIVGSRFERFNIKSKDFDFFLKGRCRFTDDSVMSLAICAAFLRSDDGYKDLSVNAIKCMQELGKRYPLAGYGGFFSKWLRSKDPKPYNSFGNGAAMRVSACGYVGKSIDDVKELSRMVTEVTHNHPEGIKGAEATAVAVFLAKNKVDKSEIRKYIQENYYDINYGLDFIRPIYVFDITCLGTVPPAIIAFLESTDFEDAIRNAISLGGDSDTIAAITGSIAGAYYGVPKEIREEALSFLDEPLKAILLDFESRYV